MLEYSIIQTRGFANVTEDGRVTGFRLLVRMPNYRGAWGSLIEGADVTVDGRALDQASPGTPVVGHPDQQPEAGYPAVLDDVGESSRLDDAVFEHGPQVLTSSGNSGMASHGSSAPRAG